MKHVGKKPTNSTVEILFDDPKNTSGILFGVSGIGGRSIVVMNDSGVPLVPDTVIYERTSTRGRQNDRKKTLSRIQIDNKVSRSTWSASYPWKTIDFIFSIDTNSKQLGNTTMHCTVVNYINQHDNLFEPEFILGFLFTDAKISAEKVGWFHLIDRLLAFNRNTLVGKRTLLLTDHDLGSHYDVNKRVIDIVPGCKIPQGFFLGYASTDRADDMANKLVKICYKQSTAILDALDIKMLGNLPAIRKESPFCKNFILAKNLEHPSAHWIL